MNYGKHLIEMEIFETENKRREKQKIRKRKLLAALVRNQ